MSSSTSASPCRRFTLAEIRSATKDFHDKLCIGKGGFGNVYKGKIISEGQDLVVAIKRLHSTSHQGESEFRTEIELLSKLRHCHLVSLIGYCEENKEMILVYEYMRHGTLYDRLHKAVTPPLNWVQRLKIAIGAARGLDYLHTGFGTHHGIIHRDVKTSNILLDENMNALISDFGLSRIGPTNGSISFVDASVKGTFGYLDPEYFYTRRLTRKTDVFAFGVVLFELLSGRLPVDEHYGEDQCSLVRWAQKCLKQGKLDQMVDSNIKGTIFPKCLRGFAQIAGRCLHSLPNKRPTMTEVVASLQALLQLQIKPASSSGLTRFTWKIHKYLVSQTTPISETTQISDQCGVAVHTPAPGPLDIYENKALDGIDTHNSALMAIIAALEDESKQIIGIHGIGGVGKTTLAMEVAARVKTNMLFADVAFTTVSQTVNAEKIQKDLESATKRIVKGEKVLIILDDVWEKLNLEELCIPINHTNCKILLTSRSESVCEKMNSQSKICVNSLPAKEAWILFKRVIGERMETDADLKAVAEEVAKECGGLPLLIQAIGSTLKDESIKSWESALTQLQKHAPLDIDQEIRKSFSHLKLSYDYLQSEEAKWCFLLCSMFPEDFDILLEDLVNYGVGLGKFDDLDNMEDARDRVQNAVNILTSSGLLLNVEDEEEHRTKMHVVVRDVALLIASQGNNKFLVKARQGLIEWLPRATSLESYTGISLMYNDIIKLPDYEVYLPHLQFFLVNNNYELQMISDEFIGCMKEVKVLDISWNNISSLPQSFQLLTKLRTLNLRGNKSLHEISILGELTDLEILILNGTGIAVIPKEIAQLANLRVLQVNDCKDLSRITQGVISALSRLEELCIEFKLNFNGASNCIVEVMRLPKLTYLDLTVPSIDDIPAQCFNTEKLKGFVIQIGKYHRSYFNMSRLGRCNLVLSRVHLRIPLVEWLKKLIEGRRPCLIFNGIENLNNIMPALYDEGFNKLEHIQLEEGDNVSCLVDDSTKCDGDDGKTSEKYLMELKHLKLSVLNKLELIWKCPDEHVSLANLVTLKIEYCKKLERVFTVSVAQGLVNLKDLSIESCDGLEEVIYGGGDGGDDESGNVIVFPSLTTISLYGLSKLKSFNSAGNCSIEYPSLVDVEIDDCESMKIWGPGIHKTSNLKTLVWNHDVPIVVDGPFAINEAVEKSWRKCQVDDDDE